MRTTFYIFALLITSVSVIACNKEDSQLQNNINTPTEEVKSSLLLMREEEKLAHDVYVTLYEKWACPSSTTFRAVSKGIQMLCWTSWK